MSDYRVQHRTWPVPQLEQTDYECAVGAPGLVFLAECSGRRHLAAAQEGDVAQILYKPAGHDAPVAHAARRIVAATVLPYTRLSELVMKGYKLVANGRDCMDGTAEATSPLELIALDLAPSR
jgi:hypothetical protein